MTTPILWSSIAPVKTLGSATSTAAVINIETAMMKILSIREAFFKLRAIPEKIPGDWSISTVRFIGFGLLMIGCMLVLMKYPLFLVFNAHERQLYF